MWVTVSGYDYLVVAGPPLPVGGTSIADPKWREAKAFWRSLFS